MNQDPAALLEQGCAALGLELSADQLAALLRYAGELLKWRRVYNLVATTEPGELIAAHLLDCLAVAPLLRGRRLLDIGSGAGLPGVPLALVRPDLQVVLLDPNAKRTRFLTHLVGALPLANVEVVRMRAQTYTPAQRFDSVVARALCDWPVLVALAEPLLEQTGQILAMKGRVEDEKLHDSRGITVAGVIPLAVPGVTGARCVVRGVRAA